MSIDNTAVVVSGESLELFCFQLKLIAFRFTVGGQQSRLISPHIHIYSLLNKVITGTDTFGEDILMCFFPLQPLCIHMFCIPDIHPQEPHICF